MFGEGSNKLLLPTQSICNLVCVCWMYACYKINMFKPIGTSSHSIDTLVETLTTDLKSVLSWCNSNNMSLNVSKT